MRLTAGVFKMSGAIAVNRTSRARTIFGRQWLAAGASSAAATTAGAATTATTTASARATRTAATASTAALATSATSTRTAATAATVSVSAASGGTARRATNHGIGSRPQAMAHRAAERVEYGHDNQSDPYDKKCIFSHSLAGLLPPRAFEGTQHDEDLYRRRCQALVPRRNPLRV